MPRLFVALRPPPEIRARLATLLHGVPAARWQSDAQLHLTLRYIGEVDAVTADDVAAALAAVRAPPIAVRLAGVGAFERRERVHTLWVGVTPHEPIGRLNRKVERALTGVGLAPERRAFMPHITVARLALGAGAEAASARWQIENAAFASEPFAFTTIVLVESHLHRNGSDYIEQIRWPLRD